jgi:hypothetical protein
MMTEEQVNELWCVAQYGTYNEYLHYDGNLGDGVTSPAYVLLGVYDSEEEAREEEDRILADPDDYRAVLAMPFEPGDFFSRRYAGNWGYQECCAEVIRDAVQDDIWHACADADDARAVYERRREHTCPECLLPGVRRRSGRRRRGLTR